MSEKQLKFGDWVWINSQLFRRSKTEKILPREGMIPIYKNYKYWHNALTPLKKVLFLGKRTLQNGYREHDYEYGFYFTQKETIKAALVCEKSNKKPFYVLFEDIKTIEPF